MYKVILFLLITLGIAIPIDAVNAKPTNHSEQKIKKHKHKHRNRKKPVIVDDKYNAFLKDCGIFGCSSNTYTSFRAPMNGDISAGEYWAIEYEREELKKKKTVTAKAPTPTIKKEKECSGFFTICDRDSGPYMEAKKWEGKSAKENRQELKAFLAQGNNNVPVDPAKIPWCAAFANAILNRQGYVTTGSLAARSFLSWGIKTKDPKEGDIVVLKRGRSNFTGHVGFFQGYELVDGIKYVKVLGGNTDHAVQAGYYPSGKVLGYRRAV